MISRLGLQEERQTVDGGLALPVPGLRVKVFSLGGRPSLMLNCEPWPSIHALSLTRLP